MIHSLSEKQYTLKIAIGTFISILLVLVGVLVLAIFYVESKKNMLDFSDQVIQEVVSRTDKQITNYLDIPKTGVKQTLTLVRDEVLDAQNLDDLEAYFFGYLTVHPRISQMYFGNEAGEFIMVKRQPNGALSTKQVKRQGLKRQRHVIWKHRQPGAGFSQFVEHIDHEDQYDPRQRPWYTFWEQPSRKKNKLPNYLAQPHQPNWTDVYVFQSDRKPGITASLPLVKENQLQGVFSADLALSDLSHFLSTLKIGKTGQAIILSHQTQLIASPNADELVMAAQNSDAPPQLRTIDQSSSPELRALSQQKDFQVLFQSVSSDSRRFNFEEQKIRYLATLFPITLQGGSPWVIGILVPEDDFLGKIKETMWHASAVITGIILVFLLLGIKFTNMLSRSLRKLITESDRIKGFDFSRGEMSPSRFKEVHEVLMAFEAMKMGLRSFGRYLPSKLVQILLAEAIEPEQGGEVRNLTILFTDIRKFTTISEEMGATPLAEKLGEYFSDLTNIIQADESQGIVDKYLGDSVMAFWGAPMDVSSHPDKACDAVLKCLNACQELQKRFPDSPEFHTCFGLHTENVVVGNFGSKERLDYTCIGDGVNLASRLEQINKYYGTQVVISENTYEPVREKYEVRFLDVVAVKGKKHGVRIYELLGRKGEVDSNIVEQARQYERAFEQFLGRQWDTAIEILDEMIKAQPNDASYEMLRQRCLDCQTQPPGEDWEGINVMQSK